MKLLALVLFLVTLPARAAFMFQYGLNYSSSKDNSEDSEYEAKKMFHKLYLGASVNGGKTVFFGWNINKWSSNLKQGDNEEDAYNILEMGPRLVWYLNEDYNWYLSAEWNPYARGDRDKAGESRDISGSSLGFGIGYRYKLSRLFGFGAGIHYHSLGLSEEKIDSTEENSSDKINHLMPMLELTLITK